MRLVTTYLMILLLASAALASTPIKSAKEGIQWQSWSDSLFERAKKENKFVVLDLEAVWCHWCHVMDKETYSNPDVIKIFNSRFIGVKVDQDSRPDLSNRYSDWGWPATIFFNSDGSEIVKRAGYIAPDDMIALLKAIIKDPSPGPSVSREATISYAAHGALSEELRKQLQQRHVNGYDSKYGGWGSFHKFLDWDSVEYAMELSRAGEKKEERMAKQTLAAQLNLLDPVWGGVYQYSTDGDWQHPHFEKIMEMQAENLRIYAQAYALWHDPSYLKAATSIQKYLKSFLRNPKGGYYTSQDADLVQGQHSAGYFKLNDVERRKRGVPRIDRHQYARENGWVANALVELYKATGDAQYLTEAIKTTEWVMANRSLGKGGFRHDQNDQAGPYLGDTLAMGRAFLNLYSATGNRAWLSRAEESADFIASHFKNMMADGSFAGFATADTSRSTLNRPQPLLEENVDMARFANLLFHYSGKPEYKALADGAMRYLATPQVANKYKILVAGILLADREIAVEPAHITVVGKKEDPQARALFLAALKYPATYKRTEWWDKREGQLPHNDVELPELPQAAAFACANRRCSLPVFQPQGVADMMVRLSKAQ